ncbi:hypothetical protein MKW98_032173 [Papaver atlanticum]|uniref:Uncharacterized protein n=1 Tax=Papaver atlanticum TaxID=357466 RepID=A0AAD4SFR6_9MAGN|nr:hypothetical protein MKW98_032173 [Papaver atlanticum]
MVCSSQGFPNLECLDLYGINSTAWKVEQGGMPQLNKLHLVSCDKLSMLPEGLRFMTDLKTLKIEETPFLKGRVVDGGEDWYKVQHIPSITYHDIACP